MTYFCMLRLGKVTDTCWKGYCDKNYKNCIHIIKNTKKKKELMRWD